MSQQQTEQPTPMDGQPQQPTQQPQQDDYAAALDAALDDGNKSEQKAAQQPPAPEGGQPAEQPKQDAAQNAPQPAPTQQPQPQPAPATPPDGRAQPAPATPPVAAPPLPQPAQYAQPLPQPMAHPMPQPQPAPQPQPEPVKTVALPEGIKEEWENLKKFSPEAAQLALEDSPAGAQIRSRLEEYGADLAFDRAAVILGQRNNDLKAQQADAARARQNVEVHNQHFQSVLQRDHPDYVALLSDPNRRAEAQAKVQDIFNWIGTLPYAEGAKLMPIAQSGRNPEEVSALLTRYERERGGGKQAAAQQRRPDPTGALAVPGRGGTVAPAGVGDKDDFDAALDAGLSSEK